MVRGKQFRVSEGEVIRVPNFTADEGSPVEFQVLARGGGDGIEIGTPVIEGATVTGTVVKHGRERKIIVFKMKRKKQYKRTHGHRQNFTAVRIDSIGVASANESSAPVEDDAPSGE
jgi:large subunit ribosomal protein L21